MSLISIYTSLAPILEPLVTPTPVIVQEQQGMSEDSLGNYLSIKITPIEQVGSTTSEYSSGANFTIQSQWKVVMNVISSGNNAFENIIKLVSKIKLATTREKLNAAGFTYAYEESVRSSPKYLGNGWEQRYVVDIHFNTIFQEIDNPNYIEFLEITNTIQDLNGNTITSDDFVVDIVP
jgi:hypothetical protein